MRTVANDLDAERIRLADALASNSCGQIIVAAELARAQLVYRTLALRDAIDNIEHGGSTDDYVSHS